MPNDRSEYLKAYRQSYKTRHKRVTVVYTADEFKKVEADAKSAQMPVTSLVRARSLDAEPIIAPSSVYENGESAEKQLIFLLRNIANNINQMAYHSNRLRMVLDENEPLLALQQLEDEVRAFLRKRSSHDR